jgi:nitroreductase
MQSSATYNKILSSLVEANQLWAASVPILILGVAKRNFSRNDTPNPYHLFDLGSASGFLALQASAIGLAAHQIGGFSKEAARAALGIPETFELGSVIALGYQGEPATLPNERLLSTETAPRSRKPLEEIVLSAWDEPARLA